ncbi:MAG: restriction endonuclease subunit S [Cyclobacteriaceae bacterium]
MNTWEEIQLGKLFQIKHGWAFKGEYFSSEGDLIVVTPGNFFEQGGFRVRDGKEKFYLGKFPDEYLLKRNDVVIAMTEQGPGLIGSPGLVPSNNKFLHNQRIGLISDIKKDKIFSKFIYYLFFTNGVRNEIFGSATGTKVKHTAPKRIYQIKILLPPLSTQRKIASILSAYDDLIENNLKRIKLLEELAQRTYEEWFVKFTVNGEQVEINADTGLPEGWKKVSMTEIAEFLNGFAFKPTDWFVTGFPIIKIKELKAGIGNDTPRNDGSRVPNKFLIKSGDILFSWSGSLEVVIWQGEDGWLNQHLFKVTPINGTPREFVHQALLYALSEFNNLTTGATMKHLKRKELDFVKVSIPNKELLQEFEKNVNPVQEQILNLSKQNRLLKEARDILLPRLMSGVINLEEAKEETLAIAAEPLEFYKSKSTTR